MNDSRLTAYALGELPAPAREVFEKELASSPALQQELEQIIALSEALPAALASDDALTDSQRASLHVRYGESRRALRRERVFRRNLLIGGISAAAAGLAATAFLLPHPAEPPTPFAAEPLRGDVSLPVAASDGKKESVSSPQVALAAQPSDALAKNDTKAAEVSIIPMQFAALDAMQAPLASAAPSAPVAGENKNGVAESDRESSVATRRPETVDARLGNENAKPLSIVAGGLASRSGKDFADRAALADGTREDVSLRGKLYASAENPSAGATATFGTPMEAGKIAADESYQSISPSAFQAVRETPLSTFSIDVDTASYANVRRFLSGGNLPPADAVRIEEFINYFPYAYPQPEGDAPFSVNATVSRAPWEPRHLLARIALRGRELADDQLPPSNLVFLVDVSGSMDEPDKLPLLQRSLLALVDRISDKDRVAIVTYAGNSGLALRSTSGEDKARIRHAVEALGAGGSTNGAAGIQLAYEIARKNFLPKGNNRVILCTDGDFNVGVTSQDELTRLIERERKSGVFLSVLGFGTGNLKDATMESLADKGNGNYAYIDSPAEGRKVLVDQMRANLFTIAKDVKIQVEFNPAQVAAYRLLGYENRALAKEDFNNDRKDAGEIGAGHTVTAFYEIIPAGQPVPGGVDPLKYQTPEKPAESTRPASSDLLTVKLRYKQPDGDTSRLLEKTVAADPVEFDAAPEDFRFAAAVAAFGMKLRGGDEDATMDWSTIQKIARGSLGEDASAYRAEFLTLVQKARQLSRDE